MFQQKFIFKILKIKKKPLEILGYSQKNIKFYDFQHKLNQLESTTIKHKKTNFNYIINFKYAIKNTQLMI